MAGLFLGGMLPFLFSALAMQAVGRAAMAMIKEVRRQFRGIPELTKALEVMRNNEGKELHELSEADQKTMNDADGKAEYEKCVEISTKASIREMVVPGLIAVIVPVVIGFAGGAEMLGGLLAGVTVSGVLMAIFQSNAGGAWDNAKKMVEEGVEIDGEQYGKGSEPHKAAVVGDTVGDPFKDTSGPSLNILLKLMSVVALVIAPMLQVTDNSMNQENDDQEGYMIQDSIDESTVETDSESTAYFTNLMDEEKDGKKKGKKKKNCSSECSKECKGKNDEACKGKSKGAC